MKAGVFFLIGFAFVWLKGHELRAQNMELSQKSFPTVSVVVIDPGHGGRDPGAVYGNAREKDIVLDISKKLGRYLSEAFPGIKVIYTRENDVFVPLYRRAAIANENNANLFISIHVNAVARGMVQGTETYILGEHRTQDNLEVAKKENEVILLEDNYSQTYEGFDPNSSESYIMFELVQDEYLEQSAMFAASIQDQFRERARRIDRSVRQAGFLVLRETAMPGVLVEAGFLSHPSDRQYLMSEKGRDYLASAIFRAFQDYKTKVEQKSIFTLASGEGQNEQEEEVPPKRSSSSSDIWFSVQVAAFSNSLEINPENFNGESGIFEGKDDGIHRYFSGRFDSLEKAREEKKRLQPKFSGAFVVAFREGELISVKKALQKM